MSCGIYKLNFEGTDKVYIGQSLCIEERFKGHKSKMRRGLASKKLMEAYTLYGFPSLEILCECDESSLNDEENEAIEIFDSVNNGFNKYDRAGGRNKVHLYGDLNGMAVFHNEQIEEVFYLLLENKLTQQEIANKARVSLTRKEVDFA